MVAMNAGLRTDNPKLKDVADGTPINVRVLAQSALNRSNEVLASSGVSNWTQEYNKANPTAKLNDVSLKQIIAAKPIVSKLLPILNKYRGDSIDQLGTDMKKDTTLAKDQTLQAAWATFQDQLGVKPEGLQKMTADREAASKISAKGADAQAPSTDDVTAFTKGLSTYKYIPADRKEMYATQLSRAATKGDLDKIQARIDSDEKSGQTHFDTQTAQQDTRNDAFLNKGLEANEKLLNDAHYGYFGAFAQIEQTRASIAAGVEGNALLTAMIPTMEVLGINHTAGITRISPAEAAAAGQSPEFATRWNAWATKASTGALTGEMAKEGNQLMDILSTGAHNKLIKAQQVLAARGMDTSKMPSADINGEVTTLDTQLSKGKRITSGAGAKVAGTPAKGDIKTFKGDTYLFDGKVWNKQVNQ
jgi:hypothetical protein